MSDTIEITRAEYDCLKAGAQNLMDLRSYDNAKADLASGDDELVPSALVDRLLAGESPIIVWREHRGMNQTDLAKASSVHRVHLAHIESGRRSASVDTLKKLAAALGVTLDDLV